MKTTDDGFTPKAHPCNGYDVFPCRYEDCPSYETWTPWMQDKYKERVKNATE